MEENIANFDSDNDDDDTDLPQVFFDPVVPLTLCFSKHSAIVLIVYDPCPGRYPGGLRVLLFTFIIPSFVS